jgi:hypothetical protein
MREIYGYFAVVTLLLAGCFNKPFQPTPPAFKTWEKSGVSEDGVKQAMLKCGYPNVGGFAGIKYLLNDAATAERCMFEAGFRYKDGWGGICSLKDADALPACEEK